MNIVRRLIQCLANVFLWITTWRPGEKITPLSVNYHFTRRCNYHCGFCFHTAKTSFLLPLEDAKRGLKLLREAGTEKINFSGGEPFLEDRGEHLGKMIKYCKEELKFPSVSIVSNGSLIRRPWFARYGQYLDILAISCDSFDEETNEVIGRGQGNTTRNKGKHVKKLHQIHEWCKEYKVDLKINTVVMTYNMNEDMRDNISKLEPVRWKVFQCLLLEGENVGEAALHNAERFYISDEEFNAFIKRHESVPSLVEESNLKMKNSYLILDEYMRFLNCQSGKKVPSASILDVGVFNAITDSGFDEAMFKKRGGVYRWTNADKLLDF